MSVLIRGRNFLLFCGVIYLLVLLCLVNPRVQREVFYLHNVKFPWFADLRRPELSGFNADRARSLFIEEKLHAWHIDPLSSLSALTPTSKIHANSKLIIYFHGTAGTIAVPHRLTTYRIFSALPETHVLAIDYRGYGLSKGYPSEAGLIEDGSLAVLWAIDQGFDSTKITLFGQSLGAAVAIATAHSLANRTTEPIHVGHVVSAAGFSNARNILKTYQLGGFIPVLGPLRTYPWIQNLLLKQLKHQWDSESRVYDLAANTDIRLTFAHATTDTEILSTHSEKLLFKALAGANLKVLSRNEADSPETDSGQESSLHRATEESEKIVYKEFSWGAHNLVSWNDDLLMLL